jgi:hypothetical protein
MIIINDLSDNEEIKKIILKYNLNSPKFWINDNVTLKPNSKELMFNWNLESNSFYEKSNNIKIIKIFKFDDISPYWYLLKNEFGDESYFLEDCLMIKTPTYKPKKLIIEFFEFINKK